MSSCLSSVRSSSIVQISPSHTETRSLPRIREYCTSAPPTYLGLFPLLLLPHDFLVLLPPSRSSSPLLRLPFLQSPPATKPHTPPSSSSTTQTSTSHPRHETFVRGACPWPRPTDLHLHILTQQGSSSADRPTDPNRWPEPYTPSDNDDVDDADDSLHSPPPRDTPPSFRGTHLPKTSPLATARTGTHTGRLEILLLSRARTTQQHNPRHRGQLPRYQRSQPPHNQQPPPVLRTFNHQPTTKRPGPPHPKTSPIIHHSIKWQHLPRLPPNITQHTPPAPAPARTTSASSPAYPRLPPAPPPFPPPSAAAAAAPHTAAYAAPPA